MALPQNPKIGDIITELQDLTLINQKSEMAGVVGAPTTPTSNNQDFVSTIQDAKDVIATKTGQSNTLPLLEMANGIVTGKKWASGTVEFSTTSLTFTYVNGGTNSNRFITVSGLGFKPSYIIAKAIDSTNRAYFIIFESLNVPNTDANNTILVTSNNFANDSNNTTARYLFKVDGSSAYVENGGFRLPISASINYHWIAFE